MKVGSVLSVKYSGKYDRKVIRGDCQVRTAYRSVLLAAEVAIDGDDKEVGSNGGRSRWILGG